MWRVISEEDLTCTECYHPIPAGEECLSQMPTDIPDNLRRRNCQNFCIRCARCNSKKEKPPCYVRRLTHWYVPKTLVDEHVSCVSCGVNLTEGKRAIVQKFYAWTDFPRGLVSDNVGTISGDSVPGISIATRKPQLGEWHNLSPDLQNRLRNAGLGNGRGGARTTPEAKIFYKRNIPHHVRNGGDPTVKCLHQWTGCKSYQVGTECAQPS